MRDKRTQKNANGGQGLVEYVLVLVLIALICITALTLLGRETERLIPNSNQWEARPEE